ncbi:MAG: hypothetical protein NC548_23825 [Lachnospiraceae bacterium]|nr:hypothetical protein [Lachnospiraceae bacterium]
MERFTYWLGSYACVRSDREPRRFDSVCFNCSGLGKCAEEHKECNLYKAVNRLGQYEDMQEKVEKRLAEVRAGPWFPVWFQRAGGGRP